MRAFAALFSGMWKYSAGRRALVALYVCMFLGANTVYLLEPYFVGKLLNVVQEAATHPDPLQAIGWYLGCIVLVTFLFWALHGPARVLEQSNAFHAAVAFRDHLFRIVVSLPVQWHKNNHSGRTINRMGKASRALFDFSENTFQLIEMGVRLFGSIIALTLLLPMAAALAISVTLIALVIVFAFDKLLMPRYEAINEKEHFSAMALHDYVTNIITVITLRLERLAQTELWKRMTHYFPFFRRTGVINESKWFMVSVVIAGMTAVVLGWYSYTSVTAGLPLLAGTFYMLYDYLQKIGGAFYTFAWKYSQTVHQHADLRSVQPILEAERAEYHADCKLPAAWQRIDIKHLDFVYKDEEKREHHLKDVSLSLGRRAKIAFVGESGSGKSTLMSLIRGLHAPNRAEVLADGKPLAHGLRDVGSAVTLIPQEPEIFENTIEYNITLNTEQTNAEVMDDIRLACFESTLEKLPKGLQTNTAEKGVNLSGGEKQRLALARGFFAAKQSDIILLDEPTSSVDSTNELKIYRNLLERFADKCIVSSIHKLHLLELFEEVYVFDEGRVVQHGKFTDLIATPGPLQTLWEAYNRRKLAATI